MPPLFTIEHGGLAVVQVSGPDYGSLLTTALGFPTDSGDLALFSAAADGTGPHGAELVPASPGPPPVTYPPTSRGVEPDLLLAVDKGEYTLRVRWYTELGDDGCFARWLLLPR